MARAFIVISLLIVSSFLTVNSAETINWDEIIDKVNNNNEAKWKAGLNFPRDTPKSYFKGLQGTILDNLENSKYNTHPSFLDEISEDDIPDEFDASEKWPLCKNVVRHIRDQGACGSCWAVAAASAFTDGLCIANKLSPDKMISSEEVLACTIIGGCHGGFLPLAWFHIKHSGSETGGDYNSQKGCIPYSIAPCEHHIHGPRTNCTEIASTPSCPNQCTNKQYPLPLSKDRYYAKAFYYVLGEKLIQKAILTSGSVEAGFFVFEDFLAYKSGVYHHVSGSFLGGHAVKVFGWGTENNTPYWLVANSWNSDWGDKGFFKILRGSNECGFEMNVFSGLY